MEQDWFSFLKHNTPLSQVSTSDAGSVITSLPKHFSFPGEHNTVEVTLQQRMVMTLGQSFTIRENNVTVATGMVTKLLPSVEIPARRLDKVDFDKILLKQFFCIMFM